MNRPTRVPASSVVRMNTTSNMIAKWYQSASSPRPKLLPKMLAMPTASEGAPPVRANSVCSPMAWASACICCAVNGNLGCAADDAGAGVDGEIDARIEERRGDHGHDGDERLERHAAVADQAH